MTTHILKTGFEKLDKKNTFWVDVDVKESEPVDKNKTFWIDIPDSKVSKDMLIDTYTKDELQQYLYGNWRIEDMKKPSN